MCSRKVLVVDDDEEDKFILKDVLDTMNASDQVEYADNGEHAIQMLLSNYENNTLPCLVVLDLNMPKMDGTQTLVWLKKDIRFKEVPVIIYSTSINRFEKEKCMNLGAYSYITKPVSFDESVETAKYFLAFCKYK